MSRQRIHVGGGGGECKRLEEQLCFLWEECLEDSTLDWNFTGPACFNDDCGIAQGEGVRNSEASITLPLDMEPCLDVCFDLTITDNVGCQVDTSFSLDVRGLPSVEGLTVMEAFGSSQASRPSIRLVPFLVQTTPTHLNALARRCSRVTRQMHFVLAANIC